MTINIAAEVVGQVEERLRTLKRDAANIAPLGVSNFVGAEVVQAEYELVVEGIEQAAVEVSSRIADLVASLEAISQSFAEADRALVAALAAP